MQYLAAKFGINHLLFLTLTFPECVTCIREAQRRFHSLRTHVLAARYSAFIAVVERHASGGIHFHLLVVVDWDTGRDSFDWQAVRQRDYRSANPMLRAEWAFWRETAARYSFGRTEALPVRSTAEGIARYVGKYISKHIGQRREEDKGVRLVRFSEGARVVTNRFAWHNMASRLWRARLAQFAKRHRVADLDGMCEHFGPRWAYRLRESIMATVLPEDGSIHADLLAAQREEFVERLQILGPALGESPRVLWDRLWPGLRNPFDRFALSVGGVEVVTIDHQKEKNRMNLHNDPQKAPAFFNERGERLGNAYLTACRVRGVEAAPVGWMHNTKDPAALLAVVFVGVEPVEISAFTEPELVAQAVELSVRHAAVTAIN